MRCRFCGNEEHNQVYQVREMMLGLRDQFDYFQCAACGCLQIAAIPADITPYYPPDYFGQGRASRFPIPHWAFTMFDRHEIRQALTPGAAEAGEAPADPASALARLALARYLPGIEADLGLRILDVGCGDGGFVRSLAALGFTALVGIDPYLPQSAEMSESVQLRRTTLDDLAAEREGPVFDLIMFHHVFEHLPDPAKTLAAAARLLAPDGLCLLRLPIVPSAAWEQYGVDWVQIDAPRHFFVHSRQSLTHVAEQAGLRLRRHFCDSISFQFVGSELYRRDIPLGSARPDRLFSAETLRAYAVEAIRLNQIGRGDQAAFYLVKAA
jgi:SAM-dependent methyltransferase